MLRSSPNSRSRTPILSREGSPANSTVNLPNLPEEDVTVAPLGVSLMRSSEARSGKVVSV